MPYDNDNDDSAALTGAHHQFPLSSDDSRDVLWAGALKADLDLNGFDLSVGDNALNIEFNSASTKTLTIKNDGAGVAALSVAGGNISAGAGLISVGTTIVGTALTVGTTSLLKGNVTIGNNAATDYTLTFNASANDGVITWDEDPGQFLFDHAIKVTGNIFVENGFGLVVGHTAKVDFGAIPEFQVLGTATPDSSMGFARFENNASGPDVRFLKSRGITIGANTIVQDGDTLGRFRFQGADGGDFNTTAAQISTEVDGTPALNDIPGRLIFTTRTAGGSLSEKMRLDNAGNLTVSGTVDGKDVSTLIANVVEDTTPDLGGNLGLGTGTARSFLFNNASNAALTIDNSGAGVASLVVSGAIQASIVGSQPIFVSSTTKCTNLNADLLDGLEASVFLQNLSEDSTPDLSGNLGMGSGIARSFLFNDASNAVLTLDNSGAGLASFVASGAVQGIQLFSTIAIGTAPIVVTSTTKCANLNADLLDGISSAAFLQNMVEDTTPQCGGDLDTNGNNITGDTSITGTVLKVPNIPTSDPSVVDQLWNNSGVMTISSSDERLKRNILQIGDARDYQGVRPVSFEWRTDEFPQYPEGRYNGVIAQEVGRLFPQVVTTMPGAERYLAVNYRLLVELVPDLLPLLIKPESSDSPGYLADPVYRELWDTEMNRIRRVG